jgi:adenylylsulfate kinase-like enzyme
MDDENPIVTKLGPSADGGMVCWITGLSGSGKSTLAANVASRLRAHGEAVVMLDGDELREVFGAVADNARNHGRAGRLALAMQYARLCRTIASQGLTVVIATISLFKEVHVWNRTNLPGYFEVYLKVPVDELRSRDPKGIYRRFDAGELTDVAGLDLPIDEPEAADWMAEFRPGRTVESLADELLNQLMEKKII